MTDGKNVFEAYMRTKGQTDFTMYKGKYVVPSIQTRWIYFQVGWEMRGLFK